MTNYANMLRFVLGFLSGVYLGSEYDISPFIKRAKIIISENFPRK
jgi:hypothetical protein